jgi:ribose transport system substrate-binding protein
MEDLMSQEPLRETRHRHLGWIVVVGVLAVVASAAVAGWMSGYFKPREKVAIITWNDDSYWDQVLKGAQDAADVDKVDLTVIRMHTDEKAQTQHVQDLVAQGYKGIAISPNNPKGQEAVLNDAASKLALVTFDSDAPVANRKAFVGTDNYAAGQVCGEQVRKAIPDGGDVLISVGNSSMVNGNERRQGLIDNLLDRRPQPDRKFDPTDGELKGPHYTIVATVLDGGEQAKATEVVAAAIKAHPDLKCIVGLFSYSGAAIVKSLAETGQTGKIKVVCFDESNDTQAGVESGAIFASILQDQYRCGYEAVNMMVSAIRGNLSQGPGGVRVVPLRIWVMRPNNIADLRADRMIHTPTTKPAA